MLNFDLKPQKMKIQYLKSIVLLALIITMVNCEKKETPERIGTFTDSRDEQEYKWVRIGNQIWMAENLSFNPDSGYFDYYENDSIVSVYGYLYTIESALNACPSGWHLPSDNEWSELIDFQGGEEVAGGKLKEKGYTHWEIPNVGATNLSGFSALPGGGAQRHPLFGLYAYIFDIGERGVWWGNKSDPLADSYNVWHIDFNEKSVLAANGGNSTILHVSVRCIKD